MWVPSTLWHCALQIVSAYQVLGFIAWQREVALPYQKGNQVEKKGTLGGRRDISGLRERRG